MGCAGRLKSISEKKLITAATITGNTVHIMFLYFLDDMSIIEDINNVSTLSSGSNELFGVFQASVDDQAH